MSKLVFYFSNLRDRGALFKLRDLFGLDPVVNKWKGDLFWSGFELISNFI